MHFGLIPVLKVAFEELGVNLGSPYPTFTSISALNREAIREDFRKYFLTTEPAESL